MALDRILVHQSERRRIPLDPAEIFFLEADDYQTVIRLHGKRLLRDNRGMGQVERVRRGGFLILIHRNFIVNLRRVREIRTRKAGNGWELRLEPPSTEFSPWGGRMKQGCGMRWESRRRGSLSHTPTKFPAHVARVASTLKL